MSVETRLFLVSQLHTVADTARQVLRAVTADQVAGATRQAAREPAGKATPVMAVLAAAVVALVQPQQAGTAETVYRTPSPDLALLTAAAAAAVMLRLPVLVGLAAVQRAVLAARTMQPQILAAAAAVQAR